MEHFFSGSQDAEQFNRVRCRRVGVSIESFSIVKGRVILYGKTNYISKKNYRSNREFESYKKNNLLVKSITILLANPAEINLSFFSDSLDIFTCDFPKTDIVVIALKFNKFKLKKAKTFFVKIQSANWYEENNERLHVDTVTLECLCNLQI